MKAFLSGENLKQAIVAIIVGAVVAFISSFADGLVELLKSNSQELITGGISSFVYLIRRLHA